MISSAIVRQVTGLHVRTKNMIHQQHPHAAAAKLAKGAVNRSSGPSSRCSTISTKAVGLASGPARISALRTFTRFQVLSVGNRISSPWVPPFSILSRSFHQAASSLRGSFPLYHATASRPTTGKYIASAHSRGHLAYLKEQRHQLCAVQVFSSNHNSNHRHPFRSQQLARGAGIVGAASLLFGKTKYVLAALKFTKLASLGSMFMTIGTYSMFFGWPYATGMVGLIAVHEAGHAWVMHRKGVPFTPAVFVPFMGAVIAMKDHPKDAWDNAIIAMGGPALGSLGAGAVALGAHATDSQLLFALADFGFMINLFNLLPIGTLDGGHIVAAISRYANVAGLGLGGFLAYTGAIQSPIFILILLAGGYDTFQKFYNPHTLPPNYHRISQNQRFLLTGGYFGLIMALLVAMDANQKYRKSPERLIRERERELTFIH